MNYSPDQIEEIIRRVLKEVHISNLTLDEKKKISPDPRTSPETLAILAKDENDDVRWWVAKNPSTLPETLAILAKDNHNGVRGDVALNPNTPVEILTFLAGDECNYVLSKLAENKNTPPELLANLALIKDCRTLENVAWNPNTPSEILTILDTPSETLIVLAEDEDYNVRWWVKENPNYKPTTTITLTKQQKDAMRKLIESSQDESLKTIKF